MSKTTLRKRISLVAVTALTAGVLSVVAAPAASANIVGTNPVIAAINTVTVATGSNTSGAAITEMKALTTAATVNLARSVGLVYKDASSTTAQSATLLSTGTLTMFTLNNNVAATNIAFTATGGSFGLTIGDESPTTTPNTGTFNGARTTLAAAVAAATSVAVTWSPGGVVGTYTINVYQSSASANIAGVDDATDGTLIGSIVVTTVTEATATAAAAVSPAYSTCITDNENGALGRTSDETQSVTSGSPWYIKYILRDSTGAEIASNGNIVGTATNSALLSIGTGVQAAGTTSTVVAYSTGATGSDYDTVRVDQPTAGAPLTTTVTITYNGVTVCTKTVTIRGAADKIVVSKVAAGDLGSSTGSALWIADGTNRAGHFLVQLLDSAGNVATATSETEFALDPLTATSTITGLAFTSANLATSISSTSVHSYGVGTFTCGPTAGSSTVKLIHTSAGTGKKISTTFTPRCADGASTYTTSLDKASYNQGEIGTMTMKFLDSKGNPANSVDVVGTSQIILPMLTLVSATGTANTVTDNVGVLTYTFTVGTTTGMTAGTYTGIVDFTALTAVAATKSTPTYTLKTGGDTTTNADVLKSIVALIASINKQIQALQKLILKR